MRLWPKLWDQSFRDVSASLGEKNMFERLWVSKGWAFRLQALDAFRALEAFRGSGWGFAGCSLEYCEK